MKSICFTALSLVAYSVPGVVMAQDEPANHFTSSAGIIAGRSSVPARTSLLTDIDRDCGCALVSASNALRPGFEYVERHSPTVAMQRLHQQHGAFLD